MQRYTLAQLEAFSEAAGSAERARARIAAVAARAAGIKLSDFKKLLKELD